ncbi:MAG: hypothetical protein AAF471_03775, partial [Myxococcota bacterium]
LVQIPELIGEKDPAYKAGFRRISDITIERNKRVAERLNQDAAAPFRAGFKVYRLAQSAFARTEFTPDPTKSDEENVADLRAYAQEKETDLLTAAKQQQLLQEVLLKSGFLLNARTERLEEFSRNAVFRARDEHNQALVCLDSVLKEQTVAMLRATQEVFICLESALNTSEKLNLRAELGSWLRVF